MILSAALGVVLTSGTFVLPNSGDIADRQDNSQLSTPKQIPVGTLRSRFPWELGVGSWELGIDTAQRAEVVSAALEQFEAIDIAGRRWTAGALAGRVVLLDFWATWCAPCLADLPLLQALRQKHAREDFEILGISLDVTSRRAFVSWLNRHRIDWPQIHLRQGYAAEVPRLFGVEQLPSTVVLDRDGRPVAIDVRGDELVAIVEALVRGGR